MAVRYLAVPFHLVRGSQIAKYEESFARRIGVRYAISFSAARVGLFSLLKVLGIGAGDEVLLQVPTHVVVANAIRYTGGRPVYVDCRLEDYNIDLNEAERLITPRAKILVLQHTFGIPADLDRALDLAKRYGLTVIEDCVHALGASYDGRPIGSFGRAAIFSTEETKTISSTMGGMVVTDDRALASQIREYQEACPLPRHSLVARYLLKLATYHVVTHPYIHRWARLAYELLGRRNPLPSPTSREERQGLQPKEYVKRFSNGQSAIAHRQLQRLEQNVAHRALIAAAYSTKLSQYGFRIPEVSGRARPSWVRFPVWVPNREKAMRRLAPHCVPGTWFTSVLEEAETPSCGGYVNGQCPRAELASRHLINLPTHPRVCEADVARITKALSHNA
ncbi:MAG TPA: aminotransferase class I/II-fold pyridoxal phosphate-dependent enzyme [Candidatus Acidoferrales bacterium]|jgi:dTDP-4-amino-4,6-dideoxygalactose transaminase|nr:aminotransferase class I/II-fold pyridoxal phosphate-dependent enzyme [Candidatus Acidoferrales bacterium]